MRAPSLTFFRAAAEVEGLGLAERLVAKGVADFKGLAIQLEGLSSGWESIGQFG